MMGWTTGLAIASLLSALPARSTSDVAVPPPPAATNGLPRNGAVLVPLSAIEQRALLALPPDDLFARDRPTLIAAIDNSLRFLRAPSAQPRYPIAGVSRDRVERSLLRFRQLAIAAPDAKALRDAVLREFTLYRAAGFDGKGTVHFTGYYEAVYDASPVRTVEFRYPLYRLPPDLNRWRKPHPTRAELERGDRLRGLEIAWLRDRLEAFLVHVQGSARLVFPNKQVVTVGYAGRTDYPYTSIGAELVRDGKMRREEVTLPALIAYFRRHPQELEGYLLRNKRFVFFRETGGNPATGSLGVPVLAERSIATDRSLMPPGALALVRVALPMPVRGEDKAEKPSSQYVPRQVARFVLDQDTGGAIKGAGRVDIFMGTGAIAKARAGLIDTTGQLYYLLLQEEKQ